MIDHAWWDVRFSRRFVGALLVLFAVKVLWGMSASRREPVRRRPDLSPALPPIHKASDPAPAGQRVAKNQTRNSMGLGEVETGATSGMRSGHVYQVLNRRASSRGPSSREYQRRPFDQDVVESSLHGAGPEWIRLVDGGTLAFDGRQWNPVDQGSPR